jgi:hypothetical protein
MTSRRKGRAAKSESRTARMIFGPAPILKYENPAAYELLIERLYTDVKPRDIVEESYINDIAHWTWDLRRWRRMKICLVEAATTNAMAWVLGMPRAVRLRHLRGISDVDIQKSAEFGSPSDGSSEPISEEAAAIRRDEYMNNFQFIHDTITTRASLEELDLLERIDCRIALAESRCNAAYRELYRHRAILDHAEREKIRLIDDAQYNVIQLGKHRAKKTNKKNVA